MSASGRAQRGLQALQGGRRARGEAVLPLRDVPRHGDEPRRRLRDHRARLHLVLHRGRDDARRDRPVVLREGRPRDDELHPAAGLVLLLPLLPAPDLQVAGVGDPRHGWHSNDSDDPAVRGPVHRPAPGTAALAPPRRGDRRRADRRLDGRAHVQGRDRARVAGERGASRRSTAGRRSRAASRRRPATARRSSRRSAACSATSTSARGRRTSVRPSSRTSARRARASTTSSATSRTRRRSGTT